MTDFQPKEHNADHKISTRIIVTNTSQQDNQIPDLLQSQAYLYCIQKYGLAKPEEDVNTSADPNGTQPQKPRRINMSDILYFPTLKTLPSSDRSSKLHFDLTTVLKTCILSTTIFPHKLSWCFLAEMVKTHTRPSIASTCLLRDLTGQTATFCFSTIDDKGKRKILDCMTQKCVGSTLAIRYAEKTVVSGGGCWISIEDAKYIKIIPCDLSLLLECDKERFDALEDVDHSRLRCWNSNAHIDSHQVTSVSVCGLCRQARYCCKACQTDHWSLHKLKCPVFHHLEDIYACNYRKSNGNQPFERSITI